MITVGEMQLRRRKAAFHEGTEEEKKNIKGLGAYSLKKGEFPSGEKRKNTASIRGRREKREKIALFSALRPLRLWGKKKKKFAASGEAKKEKTHRSEKPHSLLLPGNYGHHR